MQLQVSWIFVWNIQSPSVWPFLESSVDETVKESALMPFNPSRVFVLVRLQVKVSDEADKMVHHKKRGFEPYIILWPFDVKKN